MGTKQPDISNLLASVDKRHGFPAGTMASVMQQETGGNAKYLNDPTAYHYELNDKGQRIAGKSGKESTAFGPFGILESTAKDPGFGIKPLQSKSLEDQVRFAGEYLAARVKKAGGLEPGLAGYGEGPAYAKQVLGRIGVGIGGGVSPLAMPDSQVAGAVVPGSGSGSGYGYGSGSGYGGVPDSLGGKVDALKFASLTPVKVPLPPETAAGAPQGQQTGNVGSVGSSGGADPWMQLAQYMPRAITSADFGQISQAVPQVNMTNPSWKRKL